MADVKKSNTKQPKKRSGNPMPIPGPGRPKGIPNKATSNAREAIARFVEGNADRLQGWLDQIAEEQGPEKAVRCFMDLLEYHVPKLARTEVTGADGGPIESQTLLVIQGVKPGE